MSALGVGSIQRQLNQLQQQLNALASATQAEALQPNYLTVNPDGTTSATFTGDLRARSLIDVATNGGVFDLTDTGSLTLKGTINALGVILPAASSTSSPGANSQVYWQKTNGAAVAYLAGIDDTTANQQLLKAQVTPDAQGSVDGYVLSVLDDQGTERARLQLTQTQRGSAPPTGTIGQYTELDLFLTTVAGSLLSIKIMDTDGRSSFVQDANPETANMLLAIGGTTVSLPSGWSDNKVSLNATFPNATQAFPFHSVEPLGAAHSIVSSEIGTFDTSSVTVNVNSSTAQSANVYVASIFYAT